MNALPFDGDERLATARCPGSRWLEHVQLWRPDANDELTTGNHEVAVILLAGTFDLIGGTTQWPARGARTTPFAGRAMAVFLPPRTPFRVVRDAAQTNGEMLLIAARQPEVLAAPTGKAALQAKPLLPLAGSGKSFDPNSGEWRPAETFPTSPESLPPRRFQKLSLGGLSIDRIFAPDYKAATLSVDECVLPAGSRLELADVPQRPDCDEVLVFTRGEGGRQQAVLLPQDGIDAHVVEAAERTYVALAYAGKRG